MEPSGTQPPNPMLDEDERDERDEELDLLHALRWNLLDAYRWNLLDRENEAGTRLLQLVEQLIKELEAEPGWQQRQAG
jgi:hypothetical protein